MLNALLISLFAFGTPSLVHYVAPQDMDESYVVSSFSVDVDAYILERGSRDLMLALPNGLSLSAKSDWVKQAADGSISWVGHWPSDVGPLPVFLASSNGRVSGLIYAQDQMFQIRPTASGHVIEEIDSTSFPECTGAVEPVLMDKVVPDNPHVWRSDVVELDLLMVYTQAAEDGAGGPDGMNALLRNSIDITNYALRQSQVNARIRLVHQELLEYVDSADMYQDLEWLRLNATVTQLRNAHGADLVGLVVENGGNSCGTGFIQRKNQSSFANYAYHVTARSCTAANLSLAHELGHNLGAEHDPMNTDASQVTASYPWSFGHYANGSFRTIMAYASQCESGCRRVPCYSNSSVMFNGIETGMATERENFRTIGELANVVANFKARKDTP